MAGLWFVRHWAVDDDAFTDRWEVENVDGTRFGWIDRVVDEWGRVRFECSVAVDGGLGAFKTRDAALDALTRVLGEDPGRLRHICGT